MSTTPTTTCRILSIGADELLLRVRDVILKREGYRVLSTTPSAIEISVADVDLVIVCSTVSDEEASLITVAVKAVHPDIAVIRLSWFDRNSEASFDAVCDAMFGPRELLTSIRRWERAARHA